MATNRDLLKEAIADAKAVKETAIANAKAALEEAFTPQLQSMFAAKLQEMEKEELEEEGFGKMNADSDEGFSAGMDEKALDEALAQSKLNNIAVVTNALSIASNIIGRQTAAGKVLAVAEATINTLVAGTAALKAIKTAKTPIEALAGIATMAAVIASGFKTVKEIVKVKVPGGAGGSAGSITPPTFNAPVLPQAESTRLDQGQINQIGNAASRAFVVESDITGNQEKIKRLNRQARIN
jgi:hypothetical protein